MWALNSFFERFVLSLFLKIERFVSDSAEIWICGLYIGEWLFFKLPGYIKETYFSLKSCILAP